MTITNHPLHRSGRALLTHPAPALGDDAKSPQGIRVMDPRRWQPPVDQAVHPLPRKPRLLAPPPQRPKPMTCYLKSERRQRLAVRRHSIVPVVSFNNSLQPFAHLRHWLMHSSSQSRFDLLQLCSISLAYRPPIHREHSVAPLLATDVREAKKIECLRLPLPTPSSIISCKPAKLDQPRFLGMQSQLELGESLLQILVKPLGVRPVLTSNNEIICKSDDNHVASCFCLPPLVHPQIEHVVQEDIGHQWRGTPALRRSFFTPLPPAFFQHACPQPLVVDSIEERADVSVKHPVHLLCQYSDVQGIQRIVLALARPESIREPEKIRLVDCIHHLHRRPLDYLVFQRRDAERSHPPVRFSDVHSTYRFRSISPAPQPGREFLEIAIKVLSVLPPRFPIYSRSGFALQPVVGFPQHAQVVDVVHEASEPLPLILHCCLSYPPQRALHDLPVQCPVHVLPWRLPFGQTPSLHPLRRRFAGLVRGLRHYYGSVRLPAVVHQRRTSLDFSLRPHRILLGGRRISRFSRRLLPCMPGVSDLAGYLHALPLRRVGCGLPHLLTRSASRSKFISRLNTLPARSPVNASPAPLRAPVHDSGPSWLAKPLTYDSFIHYNLPVYPGAQGGITMTKRLFSLCLIAILAGFQLSAL